MKITVSPLPREDRCDRCWKFRGTGTHAYWPDDKLCGDCVRTLLEIIDKYPPYIILIGKRIYITELEALERKVQ